MDKKIESGFSLIEFIIMISIISLIMIAIVSSKNIFNTSQVKMLAQEVINLKNDFGNFKLKYHQFPGDLQNASEIFNKSSNCQNGISPSGCDGNNNGIVDTIEESFRFWQHLSLGGFSKKNFNGIKADISENDNSFVSNDNTYESRYLSGSYLFVGSIFEPNKFEPAYGNKIYIDRTIKNYNQASEGVLNAQLASILDNKFDDGKPRTGQINAETFINVNNEQLAPYCTTIGPKGSTLFKNRITDSYNNNKTDNNCRIIFRF